MKRKTILEKLETIKCGAELAGFCYGIKLQNLKLTQDEEQAIAHLKIKFKKAG